MAIDADVWREKTVTPAEALKIAELSFGSNATTALMDYLSGGMIIAVSEHSSIFATGELTQTFHEPTSISEECWQYLQMPSQFWKAGHARFSIPHLVGFTGSLRQMVCAGIRLDREEIERYFPAAENLERTATTGVTAPQANKGGAPRKEVWDDLLIAMFERLWIGNWQPKSQGEIERAMLDWVAEQGSELGPTSVKKPAKKLFILSKM